MIDITFYSLTPFVDDYLYTNQLKLVSEKMNTPKKLEQSILSSSII